MHRDSVGSEQAIRPGEVNWMTAGRGITHSERFERARREGGRMNGIQAWIALPNEHEEVDPDFAHYDTRQLPLLEHEGIRLRLIAGEAFEMKAPVTVHSPMFYVHCELQTNASIELPQQYSERAIYVMAGSVELSSERLTSGKMAVLKPHIPVRLRALEPTHLMMLGGESVGPRYIEWNFVSSSKERIEQAKADWRAGRMPLPTYDHDEFIPLPDRSVTSPNPMS